MKPDAPDHSVYCLQRGIVGLRRRAPSGRLILLRLLYPGEVYVATGKSPFPGRHTGLQAVTEGCVTVIDWCDLPANDPQTLDWLIAAQNTELEKCEERIVELATLSASAVLARHLLEFNRLGRQLDDGAGEGFVIPLSRRDMASLLCIRPETLARLLKEFVAQGYIDLCGRQAAIVDGAALRELAANKHDGHQKMSIKIDRCH